MKRFNIMYTTGNSLVKINNELNQAWKQHKSSYFGKAPKYLTEKTAMDS